MDESLPSSQFLGSVPAVSENNRTGNQEVPGPNLTIFPPNSQGYQTLDAPSDGGGQQPTNNWKGLFSISSYTQYFNVDTDIVLNRLLSSLYPTTGDFVSKIDANPDLDYSILFDDIIGISYYSAENCFALDILSVGFSVIYGGSSRRRCINLLPLQKINYRLGGNTRISAGRLCACLDLYNVGFCDYLPRKLCNLLDAKKR
ncbi:hypothetical protein OROGR_025649 [Orobanche gracilis]